MKKFPKSTLGAYLPGVGYTITRGNIDRVRDRLVAERNRRRDDSPVKPEEIAAELLIRAPEPRHSERFNQLV